MDAGAALRRLRIRARLSLREVQRRCGVSAARLSRIENGHVDPRLSTIEAILGAFDTDLGDLGAEIGAAADASGVDAGEASPITVVLRNRSRIHETLATHGASHPRIFGSVARGTAGPNSDIDLLVDLESGRTLFDLAALRADLEQLLGVQVDVVPAAGLDGDARTEIMAEALAI
ncbi:MAG: nucleotidyltransferase domain-containing protein [Acidimicrobiia bacterium]